MSTFDEATVITGTGPSYQVILDDEWTVNANPHGGYLLALLAKAAITSDDRHPHPIAASATFLSPPALGQATIEVELLRRGRAASQARARLIQDGTARVEALFTLGTLATDPGRTWVDGPPVEVTPREQCARSPISPVDSGVRVAMLDMVDQRVDPRSLGRPAGDQNAWAAASSSGSGELRGWLSFADGTSFDPISLLYAADAFPPATFTLGSVGWVPTMELTAYIRAVPAPGPLRVRQRVRALAGSVVDQVCEIWDAKDQVVVQASQLALVRMGPAAG